MTLQTVFGILVILYSVSNLASMGLNSTCARRSSRCAAPGWSC